LHERFATAIDHALRIGKSINLAAEAYNDFAGSYERRLEPVMRKFEEGGVKSAKETPQLPPVSVQIRSIALELFAD
jgi:DNA anti-recombination protein RmuC